MTCKYYLWTFVSSGCEYPLCFVLSVCEYPLCDFSNVEDLGHTKLWPCLSAKLRFMHSILGELWRLYTANNLFVIYKNIFMVVGHNIVSSSSSPSSSSRLKWWYTVLPGAAATGNVYRTWAIMCDLYSILDGTPRPAS